jgi:hypothetical protein
MPNNLEKAQIFQNTLDKQMVQKSVTGFMEMNANLVKYTGGDTVRIPDIKTQGLKDYDRSGGFGNAGAVDLKYQTHTFDKDRGQTFNLDAMDVDETNFMATATNVMTEFQRTQVIPEVDSYRFAKIYELANADGRVSEYTPDKTTIFEQLSLDIAKLQDVIGEGEELVICMDFLTSNILDLADKIEKRLEVSEFTQGNVNTKVRSLDGVPIIRVPSARFKNEYTFLNADPYGFAPVTGAIGQNWQILARKSVIAITKTDKPRIFDPSVNQNADAYKIDYRKFHTLWIPENKLEGVYVSRKPAVAVVSPAFTLLTGHNTVTITLADGKFKAGVSLDDFSFTGTDAGALAGGTSFLRVSDTVATFTIATGNVGTDNVVTVESTALELQASAVTGAGSTV